MLHNKYKLTGIYLIFAFNLTAVQTASGEISDQVHQHKTEHGTGTQSYGYPGDTADVDRTVEITAVDIAFMPTVITVQRGETIRFVVTNLGELLHELVLGTKEEQAEHHAQMGTLSTDEMTQHMQAEVNGIVIQPGRTAEIIWTFSTDLEQIQFACHVPGHYEAGMSGSVAIREERL